MHHQRSHRKQLYNYIAMKRYKYDKEDLFLYEFAIIYQKKGM